MGRTIHRQPVNFNIPNAPDYKFLNITQFEGLHITDNPFIVSPNSASDLLNVYVDETNTLTTRPRVEKETDYLNIVTNKYDYELISFFEFDTEKVIHIRDGEDYKIWLHNKTNGAMYEILYDVDVPTIHIECFKTGEADGKIYVLAGTEYLYIQLDGINSTLRDVVNDENTYIPTTRAGKSLSNEYTTDILGNPVESGAAYEQKNVLTTKYKETYFWDANDVITAKVDALDLSNYYDEHQEIDTNTARSIYVNTVLSSNGLGFRFDSNTNSIVKVDYSSNITTILKTFSIPVEQSFELTISRNGKYIMFKDMDFPEETVNYIIDTENTSNYVKFAYAILSYRTYRLSDNGFLLEVPTFNNLTGIKVYTFDYNTNLISLYKTLSYSIGVGHYPLEIDFYGNSICYRVIGNNVSFFVPDIEIDDYISLNNVEVNDFNKRGYFRILSDTKGLYNIYNTLNPNVYGVLKMDYTYNNTTNEYDCTFTNIIKNKPKPYVHLEDSIFIQSGNKIYIGISDYLPNDKMSVMYDSDVYSTNNSIAELKYGFDKTSIFTIDSLDNSIIYENNYLKLYKSEMKRTSEPLVVVEKEYTPTDDHQFNMTHFIRYYNQYWFYGDTNKARWTGLNNPTYIPEFNYNDFGSDNKRITSMTLSSYDVLLVYKTDYINLVTPTTINDTTTFIFTESKSNVGNICIGQTITTPLTEMPIHINKTGIYTLQQLKDIQSSDRTAVLLTEKINVKFLKDLNLSSYKTVNNKYWTYFYKVDSFKNIYDLDEYYTTIYVMDDRTQMFYYWTIPFKIVKMWVDDNICYMIDETLNLYYLETNEKINIYNPNLTEYFDYGDKEIQWFWHSQVLHLGTINYLKQLVTTTFVLTDTDNLDEYGLNYKFKIFRKMASESDYTTMDGFISYVSSLTKRTTIPRFKFIKIELSNVEDDFGKNKLRLVGLGLKYKLLQGVTE